ncbi:hypothetical protein R80B4_02843 [Fibrobacteres bacterium R8-0-B4]
MSDFVKKSEYRDWLRDLKRQIKTGQIKAALSVNSRMIALYWDLGRQIAEKQEKAKWGSGFMPSLYLFPRYLDYKLFALYVVDKFDIRLLLQRADDSGTESSVNHQF